MRLFPSLLSSPGATPREEELMLQVHTFIIHEMAPSLAAIGRQPLAPSGPARHARPRTPSAAVAARRRGHLPYYLGSARRVAVITPSAAGDDTANSPPSPVAGGNDGGGGFGWGGGSGGSGIKGGGDGNNDDDDGPHPRPPRSLLPVLAALAAGTAGGAATVAALSSSQTSPARDPLTGAALPAAKDIPARVAGLSGEVGALRRLLADAYAGLHALDGRVGALEPAIDDRWGGGVEGGGGGAFAAHPGIRAGARAAAAAGRFPALADLRRRTGGGHTRRAGGGGATSVSLASGVELEGEVGCTAVAAGGSAGEAASSLVAALDTGAAAGPGPPGGPPLPSGPASATLALHGPARGGRDAWLALVEVGAAGGAGGGAAAAAQSVGVSFPPSTAALTKAAYSWQVSRRGRVTLSPVGGAGADAAPTLHPTSGTGLSAAARRGCIAHRLCSSGPPSSSTSPSSASISARYRWRDAGVSVAAFGNGAALAQVDGTPADGVSVGLVAVRRGVGGEAEGRQQPATVFGTPPAVLAASSDWSDASSGTAAPPEAWWDAGGRGSGGGHRQRTCLAATGVAEVPRRGGGGAALLSGWVSADVDGRQTSSPSSSSSTRAWGATLASPPSAAGVGWALTLAGGHARGDPLVGEAGLRVPIGGGVKDGGGSLFPGVVLVRSGGETAALVGVRSSWGF